MDGICSTGIQLYVPTSTVSSIECNRVVTLLQGANMDIFSPLECVSVMTTHSQADIIALLELKMC